jgi:hypothetical protein
VVAQASLAATIGWPAIEVTVAMQERGNVLDEMSVMVEDSLDDMLDVAWDGEVPLVYLRLST